MTYFHACVGCMHKSADCPSLIPIKTALIGIRVTSIKHTCREREMLYAPGDAVLVETVPFMGGEKYEGEEPPKLWFPATFIMLSGPSAICFIKADVEVDGYSFEPKVGSKGYVKVPLKRVMGDISRRCIPDIRECYSCNRRPALEGGCGYQAPYPGHPFPSDCIAKSSASPPEPSNG